MFNYTSVNLVTNLHQILFIIFQQNFWPLFENCLELFKNVMKRFIHKIKNILNINKLITFQKDNFYYYMIIT